MTMSKGARARKLKRIARMKDQDRASLWRSRLDQDSPSGGADAREQGTGVVEGVLGSLGRVVREVGSALLTGPSTGSPREP